MCLIATTVKQIHFALEIKAKDNSKGEIDLTIPKSFDQLCISHIFYRFQEVRNEIKMRIFPKLLFLFICLFACFLCTVPSHWCL